MAPSDSQYRVEPDRTVNAEQRRQQAVEKTPLPHKHPVERKESRQRRQRPGQQEQQHQRRDPSASTDEKAGQQKRQEHLQIDTDADVKQRIDHGVQIKRVRGQLCIKSRLAAHPQPAPDGISHEPQKHHRIRQHERHRPGRFGAVQPPGPHRTADRCKPRRRKNPSRTAHRVNEDGAPRLTLHPAHRQPGGHIPAERVIHDDRRQRIHDRRRHHVIPRRLVAVEELRQRHRHRHAVR